MEKEFVPYELALRMRNLGFNEPCFVWADIYTKENMYMYPTNKNNMNQYDETVSIPLLQQAFRWFRENHGLWVDKTVTFHFEDNLIRGYHYNIHQAKDFIVDLNKSVEFWYFGTSEEKPELTCLEKLIKIVEENELNKQSN